ncbi:MAG: hypothetical protein ACRCUI_04915 [Polymorphobacter sp.]
MSDALPAQAKGRRPTVFDDPAIDALVSMLLELARETWVTRSRLAAFEAKFGPVEDVVLDAAAETRLVAEREAFVARLFRVLEADLR